MPAFIAHMLIADAVREKLRTAQVSEDPKRQLAVFTFTREVLDKYCAYMRLGAIGPDLPYYGSVKSLIDSLLHRHNKPTGVDQWSYQLHSKDPNVFPLKMAEIIWKESNPTTGPRDPWEEEDERKFAFLCGFLTHMAADQIIHPLVNYLAGPYTKTGDARKLHAECEVHQDLYLLWRHFDNKLTMQQLKGAQLQTWTEFNSGTARQRRRLSLPFRYLIQKSFVEAHAVRPWHRKIQSWVTGFWLIQRACGNLTPYKLAHTDLFTADGQLNTDAETYLRYINCNIRGKNYDDYVTEAEKLSSIYIQALLRLHEEEIDDNAREKFLGVVQNADLAAPLEEVTAAEAQTILNNN